MQPSRAPSVVGIGELLWDCFGDRRLPGGAPANVAYHSARLGHSAAILSRVGDDSLGRELRGYLDARGLITEFLQVDAERPTGTVTVDTRDPERPSFTIHENAAWDGLEYGSAVETLVRGADAICVGTLAQRAEGSRHTIERCLEAASGALVVYDVNLRQEWFEAAWIERTLSNSRIVKLNLDEVAVMANVLQMGSAEPRRFAEALISRGPVEWVCITRAENGCLLVADGEVHDLPGVSVTVADAVGAGDAFTAALISSRLRGWPLRRSGRFANRLGALVASKSGAMPDLGSELTDLVEDAEAGVLD